MNINKKLFGEENIVYDWAERESEIVIYYEIKKSYRKMSCLRGIEQ